MAAAAVNVNVVVGKKEWVTALASTLGCKTTKVSVVDTSTVSVVWIVVGIGRVNVALLLRVVVLAAPGIQVLVSTERHQRNGEKCDEKQDGRQEPRA